MTDKSDQDWQKRLDKIQYQVTRRGSTEPAFSGKYWNHKEKGSYLCVCCHTSLFHSTTKYDSGSGWPSFYDVITADNISISSDRSLALIRDEVLCVRCGAHLGHRFADGPPPTGLRYCINSAALDFRCDRA